MKSGEDQPLFPQICRGFSIVYFVLAGVCVCLASILLMTDEFKTNSWRAVLYTMGFGDGFRFLLIIDFSLVLLTLAPVIRGIGSQRSPFRELALYTVITTLFVAFLIYAKIEIAGSGLVVFDPPPLGHHRSWTMGVEVPFVSSSELIQLVVIFNIPIVPVLILMGIQSLFRDRSQTPNELQA